MPHIEARRRFPVSLEHGFDYITDLRNWPAYWPGLVRVDPSSAWADPGDRARLTIRLLGREVDLELTLQRFERYRRVEYTSVQPGLPDARHARLFTAANGGFDYAIVVDYEPRSGLRGLLDRTVLRRGISRAVAQTLRNLGRELEAGPRD
jgi:Polyketide cyclase / dehydrase and lipid transport